MLQFDPTPHHHRRLWLLGAAAQTAAYLTAVGGGSALKRHEFLLPYLDEMRAHLPPAESLAVLVVLWHAAVAEWEASLPSEASAWALMRLRAAGLNQAHLDALLLAGLVESDARFGALYAALHPFPDEIRLTVGLLGDLLRVGADVGWRVASQLAERGLLDIHQPERPRAARPLSLPGVIWDALGGESDDLAAARLEHHRAETFAELSDFCAFLPAETAGRLLRLPELLAARALDGVVLRGMRGSGRLRVFGGVARASGRNVLLARGSDRLAERCRLLGGLALLLGAFPVIVLDLAPGEIVELPAFVGADAGFGVILGSDGGVSGEAVTACVTLTLPTADVAARRHGWSCWLVDTDNGNHDMIEQVSTRYHLTLGGVEQAARLAVAYAALDGRAHIQSADVQAACRALNQQQIDSLAARIDGGGSWDDLIVSEATRAELLSLAMRCRQRERVLAYLGAGFRGATRGVRALFAGASGTGKTLAARILAAELGLDLYRVDLASVVSKYIGETEKNLSRLFARAEEQDVILLLDEGDSLLTARTDVRSSNDRYANMETNYLLQRLEHYQGIFLVTTNTPGRIDSAFQRRMDVYIEFNPPNAAQRYDIWRLHCPAQHALEDGFMRTVAARCNLSGGQIRNAALHATVLAVDVGQPLSHAHLTEGIAREYRKMGAASPL